MNTESRKLVDANRGLSCLKCSATESKVVYTRRVWGGKIVRRRECLQCGARMTTWEKPIGLGPST